jgi:membrane protein
MSADESEAGCDAREGTRERVRHAGVQTDRSRPTLSAILDTAIAAAKDFGRDEALTQAAALAFYAALSFAPLLILLLWVSSVLGPDAQAMLIEQIRALAGQGAGEAVADVIANAEQAPSLGSFSALVSLGALLFSATGVFAQLQKTLNHIWDVQPRPGGGVRQFVRTRLLSTAMLAAFGFLLVVSLVVSTALALVLSRLGPLVAAGSFMSSVVVFSLAFAAVYKVVPDCIVETRDAFIGGALTGVLFAVGKEAIGLYLGRSSVGSAYGAAGSLLVLLVWVYFSGVVVLFGAELTQAYAARFGGGIVPDTHAVPTHRKPRPSPSA